MVEGVGARAVRSVVVGGFSSWSRDHSEQKLELRWKQGPTLTPRLGPTGPASVTQASASKVSTASSKLQQQLGAKCSNTGARESLVGDTTLKPHRGLNSCVLRPTGCSDRLKGTLSPTKQGGRYS